MTKVNRRSFIGSATVASGVAATITVGAKAATILSESRGVSPNDKIHVGLIGCGGMGRYDLSEFLRVNEVECLALADVDTEHSPARLETYVSWDPATEKIGGDERAKSLVGRRYRAPWKLPGA